jgi:hypothetical protein
MLLPKLAGVNVKLVFAAVLVVLKKYSTLVGFNPESL